MNLPYAHTLNFWKTGQTSPDKWIEKAKKIILDAGGKNLFETFGSHSSGKAGYMIAFELQDEKYKIIWPVLPVKNEGDYVAAKRQAATLLYHDVKNKCLKALVFGFRTAFFDYLMIEDGRCLSELSNIELTGHIKSIEYK